MKSNFVEYINQLDGNLIIWIQSSLTLHQLDVFFNYITDLNKNYYFQIFVILPLIIYWIMREKKTGLYKFLGLLISLIIIDSFCGLIVKKLFVRLRPFEAFSEIIQKSPASGYSFVSNHAANMFGIAVYLSVFYPRWKSLWWGLALLIGFSRMYNGVHYFTDVFFGGMIGVVISLFIARSLNSRFDLVKK